MILELPQQFYYKRSDCKVEVRNDVLYMEGNFGFEKLMYDLTYAIFGKHYCYYCNKNFKSKKMTIDHMYPVDYGGITITNNLIPSCSDCNSRKSNLTTEEFIEYNDLRTKKERARYREEMITRKEHMRLLKGFDIPKEWVTTMNLSEILVPSFGTRILGKRYDKYMNFIKKYGHFPKPIVVSSNHVLLDGWNVFMCANKLKYSKVPVVILENVVVLS
ncbi:MAG TPA: HNH endonuclease [Candidatus Merdicola faecigallinarum]|uniref:HNH endonuclease n=1 Tax=Candidatus Merdicola faecigallinarum TaxID=2840862 RepID=A0A9D1LZZ9_9FIRM|nr:HNH endonuclease [Candidatus Merdicola faecigallinarum]